MSKKALVGLVNRYCGKGDFLSIDDFVLCATKTANSYGKILAFPLPKHIHKYSSLLLLRCLIIRNAAYYDTRSISQLLQSIRNLYWIFR